MFDVASGANLGVQEARGEMQAFQDPLSQSIQNQLNMQRVNQLKTANKYAPTQAEQMIRARQLAHEYARKLNPIQLQEHLQAIRLSQAHQNALENPDQLFTQK